MFRAVITFLAACNLVSLTAQNGITGDPDWQIKPVFSQGFILVHRISIGHLVKGYPAVYELNISKPTLGNKLWHRENNFPDVGVSLQCIDYKNPTELGYAYSAAPYLEIPLSERVRASRVVMRLAWGASYVTKDFNIRTNHKNIAIGSHWNCFVQFRWLWHLQLTRNLRFEPGLSFTHVSNGRAQNPNLGLNLVSLSAGLNILLPSSSKPQVPKIDSSSRVRSRNEFLFFVAEGINERSINSPKIHTTVFSAAYQRNVRNTHKFSFGADVFFDQNYQIDYEDKFNTEPSGINKTRISVRAGYSYNIGRISLPIEVGYYVYQKVNPDAMIVSRLGVRYYADNGLVLLFGMRSHFAVAYNFEFGVGYRLYAR